MHNRIVSLRPRIGLCLIDIKKRLLLPWQQNLSNIVQFYLTGQLLASLFEILNLSFSDERQQNPQEIDV